MNYLLTGVKNNYINNIYAVLFCKNGESGINARGDDGS